MKNWQIRAIGVLTLGGSVVGIGLMTYFSVAYWPSAIVVGLFGIFTLVYAYGAYVGVQLLRRSDNAYSLAIPYWAVQVPVFFSSHVSFQFTCGGSAAVTLSTEGILLFSPTLGSAMDLNIGVEQPTTIGVNLLALIVVLALVRDRKRPAFSSAQELN